MLILFYVVGGLGTSICGIHEVEWNKYINLRFEIPSPESIIPLKRGGKGLTKVVYGYYPYWMGSAYTHLNYELLSHIAYFSVEINADGSLGSIPNVSILENLRNTAHSNGVPVMIVGTQFNDADIITLLNSADAREVAVSNLYNLVKTYGLDGVNIDFEMPDNSVKDSLTKFMSSLTIYFHDSLPGSNVSIAMPAVDWWDAFDYSQLADNTDGLFIMGYDYYWSGSSYAGPVAPLYSSTQWGPYSVIWTINDYISWGASRDKLILGCPYYGYRWPTEDSVEHSATRASATALTYRRGSDSALVYGKLWNNNSMTPWYRNYVNSDGWYQCWFDDSLSLIMKYWTVIDSGLAGAGIWALGYDGTKQELWGALKEAFYSEPVEEDCRLEVADYRLEAHPNPFSTNIVIGFKSSRVSELKGQLGFRIYDLSGRVVRALFNSELSSLDSQLSVKWDGRDDKGGDVGPGIYFCSLVVDGMKLTEKLVRIQQRVK